MAPYLGDKWAIAVKSQLSYSCAQSARCEEMKSIITLDDMNVELVSFEEEVAREFEVEDDSDDD